MYVQLHKSKTRISHLIAFQLHSLMFQGFSVFIKRKMIICYWQIINFHFLQYCLILVLHTITPKGHTQKKYTHPRLHNEAALELGVNYKDSLYKNAKFISLHS